MKQFWGTFAAAVLVEVLIYFLALATMWAGYKVLQWTGALS